MLYSGSMTGTLPSVADTDLEREGWISAEEDGFIGLVGPFWSRGEGAAREFGFAAVPQHSNPIGVVQGGMIMTFADRGLGILAWSAAGERPAVTVSFETSFIGAGRIGSFITMRGELLRRTASLVFMRGLVMSRDGIVASCQGTWKILSDRHARPAADGIAT